MCTCLIEQTLIFHTSCFQDSFKKKRQTLSRDTDTAINRLFTTPLMGALWPLCSQWWAYLQALCSRDLLHTSLCFERWSSQASGSIISIQIIFQALFWTASLHHYIAFVHVCFHLLKWGIPSAGTLTTREQQKKWKNQIWRGCLCHKQGCKSRLQS